jgi:hypothetical protein
VFLYDFIHDGEPIETGSVDLSPDQDRVLDPAVVAAEVAPCVRQQPHKIVVAAVMDAPIVFAVLRTLIPGSTPTRSISSAPGTGFRSRFSSS